MDEFEVALPGSSLHFNTKAFCHKVLLQHKEKTKSKNEIKNEISVDKE